MTLLCECCGSRGGWWLCVLRAARLPGRWSVCFGAYWVWLQSSLALPSCPWVVWFWFCSPGPEEAEGSCRDREWRMLPVTFPQTLGSADQQTPLPGQQSAREWGCCCYTHSSLSKEFPVLPWPLLNWGIMQAWSLFGEAFGQLQPFNVEGAVAGELAGVEILNEGVLWDPGEGQYPEVWVAFHPGKSNTDCLPSSLWASTAGDQMLD